MLNKKNIKLMVISLACTVAYTPAANALSIALEEPAALPSSEIPVLKAPTERYPGGKGNAEGVVKAMNNSSNSSTGALNSMDNSSSNGSGILGSTDNSSSSSSGVLNSMSGNSSNDLGVSNSMAKSTNSRGAGVLVYMEKTSQ